MGNDIVDLNAPGAVNKSQNTRFMKKVFTAEETQAIRQSNYPDAMLWALWAAKETTYKVVAKSIPDAIFSPLKYRVKLVRDEAIITGNTQTGTVTTQSGVVTVCVFFHENHVHCIGINGKHRDMRKIYHGYGFEERAYADYPSLSPAARESLAARKLALKHIAQCCGRNIEDMEIIKNGEARAPGPPMLYFKGKQDKIDISLSHDGRYVAYAFLPH